MKRNVVIALLLMAMIAFLGSAQAAEYFVSKQGSDTNSGTSRKTAFLTIQKGVDALEPGDTLTIGPGEYLENVKLQNFGDPNKETLIRAEVPGTAVLRGDISPDLDFDLVPGQRFVYVADCPQKVLSAHEADTITNLAASADAFALEFGPGRFYYDADAEKLYVSSSDFKSPDQHRYTIGLLKDHGFHMFKCRRVVLDGLAASAYRTPVGDEVLLLPVSGFMLHQSSQCAVRRCTAYFNGSGITVNSGVGSSTNQPGQGSGNVIEDCVAYANDLDGIVAYNPSGETIRNCRSFLNQTYGARFYGGRAGDALCLMQDVIAWGNPGGDYWTKGGGLSGFFDEVRGERCIAFRGCMFGNFQHGLIGGGATRPGDRPSTINLPEGHKEFLGFLDTNFADPLNYDFRFQADSSYAEPAQGGTQMGLYPYKANVHYVKTDGNDNLDGLSMANAWKTPARAVEKLKSGDTLYIAPGLYEGDLTVRGSDIRIRGRGMDPVVIDGGMRLAGGEKVTLERLQFAGPAQISESSNVELSNCVFGGQGCQINEVRELQLSHNLFIGVLQLEHCSGVSLSGNLYAAAPAVQVDSLDAVRYSSYNSYPESAQCWSLGGKMMSLDELQPRNEAYSVVMRPELMKGIKPGVIVAVGNAHQFGGRGPLSTAIGPYREWQQKPLEIMGPFVKSVTGTSADIEWWSTLPVQVEFAWGDTPECANKKSVAQNAFYSFSLTGLQPGRTYYVKVTPTNISPNADTARRFMLPEGESEPAEFTPVGGKPYQPATYYLAPDGDDAADGLSAATAWKSVQIAANRVRPGDTVLLGSGVYPGTFYFRTTGEADKPITFKAAPGARVWISGLRETLHAGFILYGKHHYRVDSLYFIGYAGIEDNVGGKENGAIFARNSDDLQITRCSLSRGWGPCLQTHECSDLLVRNCVFMGSMGSATVNQCPNVLIENSVFIAPLIAHLYVHNARGTPATVRRCIFGENTRHKVHICPVGVDGTLTDNCYYMRWSQYDRTVAQRKTFPELRAAGDADSLYANPMMPGALGWRQGWQQIKNDYESEDPYVPIEFYRLFPTNPELILRDIGLQPEAFSDFYFWKKDWPYDKEWAVKVKDGMAAAEALSKAGQHAEAATAYARLAAGNPMSERLKTEVIDRAAQCAFLAGDHEHAMTLARSIPLQPFAVRRQMVILVEQKKFAELVEAFSDEALGVTPHLSWLFPETEQLLCDIYYYRGIAYGETGNMEAAENDLRTMVNHGRRVGYSPGASVMAVSWKRLGDFYTSAAVDAYNQALETKSNPEISDALDAARKVVTKLQRK